MNTMLKNNKNKATIQPVRGYMLSKKEVGCNLYDDCFTCKYSDCIRGNGYEYREMIKARKQ